MATHEQELKDEAAALALAHAERYANMEELKKMHDSAGLSQLEQPMRKAYLELRNTHLVAQCKKLTKSIERHRAAIDWEARTR